MIYQYSLVKLLGVEYVAKSLHWLEAANPSIRNFMTNPSLSPVPKCGIFEKLNDKHSILLETKVLENEDKNHEQDDKDVIIEQEKEKSLLLN